MKRRDRGAFEIAASLLCVATFIAILISTMGMLLNLVGLIDKSWLSVLSPAICMLSLDIGCGVAFVMVAIIFEVVIKVYDRFIK
jgi:hypothetical protein